MTIFALAKKIRRKNEPWQKAIQRARIQHNRNKQKGGKPFISTARRALGATVKPEERDIGDTARAAMQGFFNTRGSLADSIRAAGREGLTKHTARNMARDAMGAAALSGSTLTNARDKFKSKLTTLRDSNKVEQFLMHKALDRIGLLSNKADLKDKINVQWVAFKNQLDAGKEEASKQLEKEIHHIADLAKSLGIPTEAAEGITNNVRKAINDRRRRLLPDERVEDKAVDILNEMIYKEKMALIEEGVLNISEVDEINRDNWVKSTTENQDKYNRLKEKIPILISLQQDLITLLRGPGEYTIDPGALANTLHSITVLIQGLDEMTTDLLDKYKQSELNYIQALGIIHQKGNSGGPPQIELQAGRY